MSNALSAELSWIRGPAERRFVLGALAELPAGSGLDTAELSALLAWRSPLRPAEQRDAVIAATIAEATALGLVAFNALTTRRPRAARRVGRRRRGRTGHARCRTRSTR